MRAFEQHLEENGYSREEELTFWDCDRNQEVRMAALLSKLAVFGGFDYNARGLSHETLYAMREVFLLSRAAIRIRRRPQAAEVLVISTWEDGTRGAHMRRVYEMTDSDGLACVSAKSDWILVDPVSRKILRPATFTARKLGLCPKTIDAPEPKKIRMPREELEALGVRTVVWSDLDGNGHLYSGNYGDIIWDFLPESLRERPVREFQINYQREAALGEELQLFAFRNRETVIQIEGRGARGTCFTAECLFS